MHKLVVTLFGLALFSTTAAAMTAEECSTSWQQADANADGVLVGAEAERFGAMMRVAGKTLPADGAITEAVFRENCGSSVFDTVAVEEGAPLEGANSFTEDQARDRAAASGLTGVSAMIKDDMGIWRGTATKDGTNVKVAVDYKGNVVHN